MNKMVKPKLTFHKDRNRNNNNKNEFKEIKETPISEPKQTYQPEQPKIKRKVKLGRPRKNKEYSSIRIQRSTTNRINAMQNTLNFKTQDDLIIDLLDKAENSLSADQKTMYKIYLKTFTARGKR